VRRRGEERRWRGGDLLHEGGNTSLMLGCEEEEWERRWEEEGRGEKEGGARRRGGVHERRHRLIPTLCGVRPGSRGTVEVRGEYPTFVRTTRGS
jgi:hypothetical protein